MNTTRFETILEAASAKRERLIRDVRNDLFTWFEFNNIEQLSGHSVFRIDGTELFLKPDSKLIWFFDTQFDEYETIEIESLSINDLILIQKGIQTTLNIVGRIIQSNI